ncbi:MAG: hypothetical protein AB1568_08540 [Thermodesulfobacteriota bacterium]
MTPPRLSPDVGLSRWNMRCGIKQLFVFLALAECSLLSGPACGAPADPIENQAEGTIAYADIGEPVSGETLQSLSGGQAMEIGTVDILLNDMKMNTGMENNQLHSTGTGLNMVTSDAFSNASGIATVIQNSGNQVIINNALILNLRMQ